MTTSGPFVQQWKLRNMAQEAALQGMANSTERRMLGHNQSPHITEIDAWNSAIFPNKLERRVPSHWRGSAGILDIDKTGVAVKSQIRTFKVARNCLRKREETMDVGDVCP